jgi:hypothetical protein
MNRLSIIDILTRTDNVLKRLSIYMINCGILNLWVSSAISSDLS